MNKAMIVTWRVVLALVLEHELGAREQLAIVIEKILTRLRDAREAAVVAARQDLSAMIEHMNDSVAEYIATGERKCTR
jgi:hypothetical protein